MCEQSLSYKHELVAPNNACIVTVCMLGRDAKGPELIFINFGVLALEENRSVGIWQKTPKNIKRKAAAP